MLLVLLDYNEAALLTKICDIKKILIFYLTKSVLLYYPLYVANCFNNSSIDQYNKKGFKILNLCKEGTANFTLDCTVPKRLSTSLFVCPVCENF